MDCPCCSNNNRFFEVNLTHQGKSHIIQASAATTGLDLHQQTLKAVFGVTDDDDNNDDNDNNDNDNDDNNNGGATSSAELLKLLFKGKRITAHPDTFPFASLASSTKKKQKPLEIMVIATNISAIQELSTKRSDPTIRGFDQEKEAIEERKTAASPKYWADASMVQHKDYKFCRMKACTDHSFGHRSTESTPHAFQAMQLLEKLATDPGIAAIMKERELVVGTLGEMDPIDDRIMQKTENSGGCLLGYNTNHGLRIDIKLRTDDLSGFRQYPELASTLIHELSHNWVGEHNLLFWTNYAQMRAEYLYTHARLRNSALIVRGKKTSELAGLDETKLEEENGVFDFIMNELVREMGQHGLHPNMIAGPIRQRIQELEEESNKARNSQGNRLGGSSKNVNRAATVDSARELAWAAAEQRAREQQGGEERR